MLSATRVFRCFPLGLALLLAVTVTGCDTAPGPSLYDPIEDGTYKAPRPDPSLTSISPPAGEALAGVTELTLTGQNFAASAESTFVYFNGKRYPVLSVTPTEIRMRAPNLPRDAENPTDSLRVVVSVLRAENFSETRRYQLLPAVERFGNITDGERPGAVALDAATGRIYVSMLTGGIQVIHPEDQSVRESSVNVSFQMTDMDFANDYLYAARSVNAAFRYKAPGGNQEVVGAISDRTVSVISVEYDEDGYTWAGGTKSSAGPRFLYRIDANRAVESFPFEGSIRGIESTPGFLYVLAERNGQTGVWRFTRNAGVLGAEEQVAALTGDFAGMVGRSFALTAEGGFLIGTSNEDDPLLYVQPDGQTVVMLEGLLAGTITSMAWLPDGRLVISNAHAVGDADSERVGTDLLVVTTLLAPQL